MINSDYFTSYKPTTRSSALKNGMMPCPLGKRQQQGNTLTDHLVLYAEAQVNYYELECFSGEYPASTQRLKEFLVTMMAKYEKAKQKQLTLKEKESTPKGGKKQEADAKSKTEKKLPHFVTHTHKHRKEEYKEGDSREWNGKTWYFHPADTH